MPKKQPDAPETPKSAFHATGSLIAIPKQPEPLSPDFVAAKQAAEDAAAKAMADRATIVEAVEAARKKAAEERISADRAAYHQEAAAAILSEKAARMQRIREDAGL